MTVAALASQDKGLEGMYIHIGLKQVALARVTCCKREIGTVMADAVIPALVFRSESPSDAMVVTVWSTMRIISIKWYCFPLDLDYLKRGMLSRASRKPRKMAEGVYVLAIALQAKINPTV